METTPGPAAFIFWIAITVCFVHQNACIRWLAISNRQSAWNRSSDCLRLSYLARAQRAICRGYIEMMPALVHASTRTIHVCQELFSDRRWNCASLTRTPDYLPDLTEGTREQAFVFALSSASIVHSISRACSAGISNRCSCGGRSIERKLQTSEADDFKWEGCNDNLDYGLNFSRMFTEAQIASLNSRRVKVNSHNYAAGRKAAMSSVSDTCKCHGVSGSCSLRTCWRTLGDVRSTGTVVQRLYDAAVQVNYRRLQEKEKRLEPAMISNRIRLSEEELVFFTQSPDYCLPEKELGSVGTKDRVCQKNASGSLSCRSMCCGRGYWTNVTQVQYRCECKYYWCCYVRCSICVKVVEVHRCH